MKYNQNNDAGMWWNKELLMAKESAVKAISILHEGKELDTESLIKESKKVIAWYYGTEDPINPHSNYQEFIKEEEDINTHLQSIKKEPF